MGVLPTRDARHVPFRAQSPNGVVRTGVERAHRLRDGCAARDADGDWNRAALAEAIEWPVACPKNARAPAPPVGVSEEVVRALDVSS